MVEGAAPTWSNTPMSFEINDQHRVFVTEYLVDFNATGAYRRAGFSQSPSDATVRSAAARLIARPEIQDLVQAGVKARLDRAKLDADRVDQEIARLAFADIRGLYNPDGSMKLPHEWDDATAAAVSGVEVTEAAGVPVAVRKAKMHEKVAALTLAAKRLGLLTEKLSVGGSEELPPISFEEAGRRVAFTLLKAAKEKKKAKDALGG